jgi:hypothetical protein
MGFRNIAHRPELKAQLLSLQRLLIEYMKVNEDFIRVMNTELRRIENWLSEIEANDYP